MVKLPQTPDYLLLIQPLVRPVSSNEPARVVFDLGIRIGEELEGPLTDLESLRQNRVDVSQIHVSLFNEVEALLQLFIDEGEPDEPIQKLRVLSDDPVGFLEGPNLVVVESRGEKDPSLPHHVGVFAHAQVVCSQFLVLVVFIEEDLDRPGWVLLRVQFLRNGHLIYQKRNHACLFLVVIVALHYQVLHEVHYVVIEYVHLVQGEQGEDGVD